MNGSPQPIRVAVLGGGVGGMTTAFELTATPELRERFDVTIYQLGWRIGGKGASGRNPEHANRIEEHGLHVWFGFYDNAFRLMRDAYEELDRPPKAPLATFYDAFKPCNELVLYDRQDGGWYPHEFHPPPNPLRPGDPGELPTFWEMAMTACRWALGRWHDLREERPQLREAEPAAEYTPDWFDSLARDVAADVLALPLSGAEHLLELAERLAATRARHTDFLLTPQAAHPAFLARLLNGFRDWLWAVARDRCDEDPHLRLFFTMVDAIAATVTGIVDDGVLERGFDTVNDQEWAAWLRRHGAHEVTLGRTPAERSPVLRAVYDVAFGYPGGDIDKANVAAGTATNDLLRLMFSYRGSLMYKMQAGMGDAVFTPLYQVLRRRGVRFEFFHAVTNLGVADQAKRVDRIDVVPQATLTVPEYEPLVNVKGLDCWPSEPLWDQLEPAALGKDFEREPNPLNREPISLRRGEHYDEVVLGIPVGALGDICEELTQRDERFRRGVETAVTVRTQAFQIWATRESEDLGWRHDTNSVAGCYVEPLDTWCDMSHLIERESWEPDDGVRAIAYVCGVLDEEGEDPTDRVKQNAIRFLEGDLGALWPKSGVPFDWSLLAAPDGGSGRDRFDSQYWRANVTASDRYVLTPAGTVDHRLAADDSGFQNLVLAGDWTKNGVDGGCVEAAVISGMQAARKLTGIDRPIAGESEAWMRPEPQGLPAYVEYGGRATAPGPFLSLGGRLRGFVLQADEERLNALVARTLSDPAGRELDYRALCPFVFLLLGGFTRVSSMASPFDRWGTVEEIQASFWVPVVAGRDLGEVFLAERLGLAVPYIFVDNPMSYLGGRETYGYAKTMGRFEPSEGVGREVKLKTFGGNFGRDEGAAWRPFLEVVAAGRRDGHAEAEPLEDAEGLVRHLAGDLPRPNSRGEIVLPDLRLSRTLVEDLLAGRVRQVFLKQFRDAADGTRACYQAVVEAPIDVTRLSFTPSATEWNITIHPLDSHPIGQELGVESGRALMAYEAELDMVVLTGTEVGRVVATPGLRTAPDGTFPVEPGGITDLIGGAAKWVWREISALERSSRKRLGWW
jgi:uncharacterized protein with NAD-binding domain and iron-sulfur cluster